MKQSQSSWKLLILAALLPILVLVAINVTGGWKNDLHPESFKRFGNAVLTSYVVMGIILIGNLFFYADSRHRPFAPFVGMMFALAVGIIVAWALISNDDLLLEANSGLTLKCFLMLYIYWLVVRLWLWHCCWPLELPLL